MFIYASITFRYKNTVGVQLQIRPKFIAINFVMWTSQGLNKPR